MGVVTVALPLSDIFLFPRSPGDVKKQNKWCFRPPLCTYRLNWAEQATSRSRRIPAIKNHYEWAGRNNLFLCNLKARVGFEPAISDFPSRSFNHVRQCMRVNGSDQSASRRAPSIHQWWVNVSWFPVRSTNAGSMLGHRLRAGPTLTQHWLNALCLLGYDTGYPTKTKRWLNVVPM